ncbi:hypothetical protein ACOSP7_010312 [Xanthoceras sorbifolium]
MVYGTKALIPTEAMVSMNRRAAFDPEQNNNLLAVNLDLIEEKRDAAGLRVAVYQQRVARYYNKKFNLRHFKKGDLVLRLLLPRTHNPQEGSLGPNWKGPYLVDENLGNGAYHLVNVNGAHVPRAWNAEHLCKYYQ